MVEDDDVIFMGAGTTTLEIARLITTMENRVTIITNSLPIAMMVGKYSHIHLIMLGGYFHRQTKSFFGPSARSAIDATSARIVFFGANGVDLTAGITGHFVEQTEIVQEMIRLSKFSVGVIDTNKFGKVCANRIAYLDQIDMLITDHNVHSEFVEAMKENNYPITIAE